MMKIKILIFIILYNYIRKCSCYSKIGEPCRIGTIVGTCKPIMKCPIAIKIVSEDTEHPPTCFWQEVNHIVCCPGNTTDVITGPTEIRTLFRSGRIKKTNDMICRYADREPFLCCGISKYQVTPEPPGCPPLPSPKLNTPVEHPAWTKCVEYQRYFNVCVAESEDNKKFIRKNTCHRNALRIMYGDYSGSKQFPHMAVIGSAGGGRSTDDIDIAWIGGGSLISDKFILTAAHVILQTKTGVPRYALLGALDKTKVQDGILYNIINRIPHKEYAFMEDSKKHDIALVELHERVIFNEFIRPVCLPVPGAAVKYRYIIAGWGLTETGKDSLTLRHTHVTENEKQCNFDIFDPEYMICAEGKLRKSADSCQGDSGGPLMATFSDLNCTYSVEGIVSYGPSCKGAGVYTRVDKYMDFIMEYVWPEEWAAYKIALNRSNEVVSGMK